MSNVPPTLPPAFPRARSLARSFLPTYLSIYLLTNLPRATWRYVLGAMLATGLRFLPWLGFHAAAAAWTRSLSPEGAGTGWIGRWGRDDGRKTRARSAVFSRVVGKQGEGKRGKRGRRKGGGAAMISFGSRISAGALHPSSSLRCPAPSAPHLNMWSSRCHQRWEVAG